MDFLSRLAERATNRGRTAQPLIPPRFATLNGLQTTRDVSDEERLREYEAIADEQAETMSGILSSKDLRSTYASEESDVMDRGDPLMNSGKRPSKMPADIGMRNIRRAQAEMDAAERFSLPAPIVDPRLSRRRDLLSSDAAQDDPMKPAGNESDLPKDTVGNGRPEGEARLETMHGKLEHDGSTQPSGWLDRSVFKRTAPDRDRQTSGINSDIRPLDPSGIHYRRALSPWGAESEEPPESFQHFRRAEREWELPVSATRDQDRVSGDSHSGASAPVDRGSSSKPSRPILAQTPRLHRMQIQALQPASVRINVGRIEVRAIMPSPSPPAAKAPILRVDNRLSLDDYLQSRDRISNE